MGCKGLDIPMALFDFRTQGFEAFQMDIDGPGTNGTASRLGNLSPPDPCQKRAHDQERGTHGAD